MTPRSPAPRPRSHLAPIATLCLVVAVIATSCLGPVRPAAASVARRRHPIHRGAPPPAPIPAVEAGVLPWQLPTPVSREVVVPSSAPGQLLVAGGLTASGSSSSGVYTLDSAGGRLSAVGSLASATHDAAGAALGSGGIVVGGGSSAPASATERLAGNGQTQASGALPRARADAAGVTIGGTAYVVGGYDGTAMDGAVLATTDGVAFQQVATLAQPVRYPAVAALGGRIYIFGGQGLNGKPVQTIQEVDPGSHQASVVGTLPLPLSGSVAANLGGTLYLAGGETQTPSGPAPVGAVYAWDPAKRSLLPAGSLRVPEAYAGGAVSGQRLWIVGGETGGGAPTADVQVVEPNPAFGQAGQVGAGSPFQGDQLLIADRGNNRLLVVNDAGQVVWSYPSPSMPAPPGGFYFPDDAFFVNGGRAIIVNQEENETILEIAYPSGRLLWSYGHPGVAGSAPGYLHNPDDAYLLPNGGVTVADPMNCRVLELTPQRTTAVQIGTPGVCLHRPPRYLGSPNGDTPLANGDLLVSEINGSWIDEFTRSGSLVWSVHLPIGYPSDPQQIGPDTYLVADYESPGAIVEFNRQGQILYRYQPASGPGALARPSLVEQLPSGMLMLNDDHNDRIVAIDPATGALVWQYGQTGTAGSAPGLLNTPDGFDLLAANGSTPTHPATG